MAAVHQTDEDDTAEYQDYWKEIQEIHEAKDRDVDTGSEEELESKTPDEAEEAADWLKSAGYEEIVNQVIEGRDIDDDFIDSVPLTKAQKVTVKRRINTLKNTLNRKRNKQNVKTDVRDIFNQQESSSSHKPPLLRGQRLPSSDVTSPISAPAVSRSVSLYRHREYNMDSDGLRQAEVGVEVLSIQPKDHSGYSASSSGSDDCLLSPHSHISMPILDSVTSMTFQQKSSSSYSSSSEPPASPASLGSSPITSPTSPSWPLKRRGSDLSVGLPVLNVEPDILGITNIDDFSAQDVAKLRHFILLELTTLLDHHHITFMRRKSKRRYKESGVFGVPLHILLEQDQKNFKKSDLKVPLVFEQLISLLCKEGITEEGILRVPGSVARIKALRKELDEKFHSGTFQWSKVRPNDAAGLLKLLLRDLPVPLLTFEYVDAFAQVEQIPDLQDRILVLRLLVLILPDVNRSTLKLLLTFLKKVIDHKGNLMTLNNVAMIMAPNLFLTQCDRLQNKAISAYQFRLAAGTSNVVRMLIFYQHLLWIVPTTMIEQLRHQNEVEQCRKSRDRPFIRLLKKDKSDVYKKPQINDEENYSRGVIRVKVPSMNKCNTAIRLDANMTAGDIVSRCLQDIAGPQDSARLTRMSGELVGRGINGGKKSHVVEPDVDINNSFLYEVGGNIGERRLSPTVKVLEVLKRNPNAEWIIRSESHNLH